MNLSEYYPILSKFDKAAAKQELKTKLKVLDDYFELIFSLYEEIQRTNKIMMSQNAKNADKASSDNDRKFQELSFKYQSLLDECQGFIQINNKIQKEFQQYQNNMIEDLKKQNFKLQKSLMPYQEEILKLQIDLDIAITSNQGFQQEIQNLNKNSQETQLERKKLLALLEELNKQNNGNQQQNNFEQNSLYHHDLVDKILKIIAQIKVVVDYSNAFLKSSKNLYDLLQDEKHSDIKQQIYQAQRLVNYNIAIFKQLEQTLPILLKQFQKLTDQADILKKQLENQQKLQNYQNIIDDHKKFKDTINKNRNEKQPTQKSQNYQLSIQNCYQIYLSVFSLAIHLIERQHLQQFPNLKQDLQSHFTQLNYQLTFTNFTELKTQVMNQSTNFMKIANYIRENNRIEDILSSWSSFINTFTEHFQDFQE